ncbi:hypothetical protein VNO78_21467 [Psophocarpus tetragonolobus]|uniref:Protein kinase domain-containing protein n=1 Tax=Psophocarpus tetragonolobus TaxID=3891 RepID=A0AAN9SBT9_PSOTE
MAVYSKQLLLIIVLFILTIVTTTQNESLASSKANCPEKCGNITIPYPFGMTLNCSFNPSFHMTCNHTFSPPILFFKKHFEYGPEFQVVNISLKGELTISLPVTTDCLLPMSIYGELLAVGWIFDLGPFQLSSTQNKLTVVGGNTVGIIKSENSLNQFSTCVSLYDNESISNGSCSGIGCCQTSIPHGLSYFSYNSYPNVFNHSRNTAWEGSPYNCSYAFLVKDGEYHFFATRTKILNLRNNTMFPVAVDWAINNHTCKDICMSKNSLCYKAPNMGHGYLCNCSAGFRGNPYLSDGCRDGYEGDGKSNGSGCKFGTNRVIIIVLSVSVGILTLLGGIFYAYWKLKKKNLIKLKEQFFQQNGGLLLQQQLAKCSGSTETTKIFTLEELEKATKNFDEGMVVGKGGQGTVYKGILHNNIVVAIKRSKISNSNQIEQFINEVIVLSRINHRNVVRLLGCCLETEVPLLVYEFIPNGTVYEHLHNEGQSLRLTWETRLQIATETAEALAYLHSAASEPIIHRDVKTANILLDYNLIAKVSDFGASKIIPLDHTQLTTLVRGTLGYLDPEYFQTSQLTEKSDVFSFGVVLVELLTGKKALSFDRPESHRNLAMHFHSTLNEGSFLNIVDRHIIDEANVEQLMDVANIAEHCLRLKGEERPTMKEVAKELERISILKKHQWEKVNLSPEDAENFLNESSSFNTTDDAEERRKKALSFERPEPHRNLAMHFHFALNKGRFLNIVDIHIIDEANVEQLMDVANIAEHCLRLKGEERPTMKEVAKELERISIVEKHRWENVNFSPEETERVLEATQSPSFDILDDVEERSVYFGSDILKQNSTSLSGGR